MKRQLKTEEEDELEELREENKRLRELVARLIGSRIAEMVEPGEQSAGGED